MSKVYTAFHFRVPQVPENPDGNYDVRWGDNYILFVPTHKVNPRGGATAVLLENGDIGIAICSQQDNYCKKVGRKIARMRALNQPDASIPEEWIEERTYKNIEHSILLLCRKKNRELVDRCKGSRHFHKTRKV